MQQVFSYYPELKARLNCIGDPLIIRLFERVISVLRGGQRDKLEQFLLELQSYLWEALHMLNWKDVNGAYRDAYSASAVILALYDMEKHEKSSHSVLKCIKNVDMGLLLGSEFMRPLLTEIAGNLQKKDNSHKVADPEPPIQSKKKRGIFGQNSLPSFVSTPIPTPIGPGPKSLMESVPRVAAPSLDVFYQNYLMCARPVVITGMVDHWPAIDGPRAWRSLFYLQTVAGSRLVPIETGRHYLAEDSGQRLMTLSSFIDTYILYTGRTDNNSGPGPGPTDQTSPMNTSTGPGPMKRFAGEDYMRQQQEPPRKSSRRTRVGKKTESSSLSEKSVASFTQSQLGSSRLGSGRGTSRGDADNDSDCASSLPEQSQTYSESGALGSPSSSIQTAAAGYLQLGDEREQLLIPSVSTIVLPRRPTGYLAQHQLFDQIPELRADFDVPDYCAMLCPDERSHDVVMNAWLGPHGTVSPLHHDPYHNLLVQVVGYKIVRLYSPSCSPGLYPLPGKMSNNSAVDVLNYDRNAHPMFACMPYRETVLGPGDALFIPRWTWHFVLAVDGPSARAHSRSTCDDHTEDRAPPAPPKPPQKSKVSTTGSSSGAHSSADAHVATNNSSASSSDDVIAVAASAGEGLRKSKRKMNIKLEAEKEKVQQDVPHCFSISFWWGDRREKGTVTSPNTNIPTQESRGQEPNK